MTKKGKGNKTVHVTGFTRTDKNGKKVHVKPYNRSPPDE